MEPNLIIELDCNDYTVFDNNANNGDGDELARFPRGRYGDQITFEMADIYKEAYQAGYQQNTINRE